MYGSGAGIGEVIILLLPKQIIMVLRVALAASIAGAVGTTVPLAAPSPAGTTTSRLTGSTPTGSAFSAQFSRLK